MRIGEEILKYTFGTFLREQSFTYQRTHPDINAHTHGVIPILISPATIRGAILEASFMGDSLQQDLPCTFWSNNRHRNVDKK